MALDERSGLAQRINGLSATELLEFVNERLRARDFHVIVRQLNSGVLSKQPDVADEAQRALARMGFAD